MVEIRNLQSVQQHLPGFVITNSVGTHSGVDDGSRGIAKLNYFYFIKLNPLALSLGHWCSFTDHQVIIRCSWFYINSEQKLLNKSAFSGVRDESTYNYSEYEVQCNFEI